MLKCFSTDFWHCHPVGAFSLVTMLTLFLKRTISFMRRRQPFHEWELWTWGNNLSTLFINPVLIHIYIYNSEYILHSTRQPIHSISISKFHFKCIRFVRANSIWFMEHQAIESRCLRVIYSTVRCQSVWLVTKEIDWDIENRKHLQHSELHEWCTIEGRLLCATHLLFWLCTGTNLSEWIGNKGMLHCNFISCVFPRRFPIITNRIFKLKIDCFDFISL